MKGFLWTISCVVEWWLLSALVIHLFNSVNSWLLLGTMVIVAAANWPVALAMFREEDDED